MPNALTVTTPNDLEIVVQREFNAPRELVWASLTRPDLLRRWLFSPPGWSMTVCEEDPRVGGTFRWVWGGADGPGMTITGVYHEVTPPERSVRTEVYEFGFPPGGGEQRVTVVLAERGDKTALTLTIRCASKDDRDRVIASGMEGGLEAGYDRLEALLAESGVSTP